MYPNTIAFFKGNGGRRESQQKEFVERWYGARETKGEKKSERERENVWNKRGLHTTLIKRHTNETNQLYNEGARERAV